MNWLKLMLHAALSSNYVFIPELCLRRGGRGYPKIPTHPGLRHPPPPPQDPPSLNLLAFSKINPKFCFGADIFSLKNTLKFFFRRFATGVKYPNFQKGQRFKEEGSRRDPPTQFWPKTHPPTVFLGIWVYKHLIQRLSTILTSVHLYFVFRRQWAKVMHDHITSPVWKFRKWGVTLQATSYVHHRMLLDVSVHARCNKFYEGAPHQIPCFTRV